MILIESLKLSGLYLFVTITLQLFLIGAWEGVKIGQT